MNFMKKVTRYFKLVTFSALLLTLSPAAVKCRRYQGIGLRRPQTTTIVEGLYDRRRELSLVPVYEICVSEEGPLVPNPPS